MKADCEIPGKQNFVQLIDTNQQAITAALEVMDRHISALNDRHTSELATTLHFPHFRLVGTSLKVWETADRYFDETYGKKDYKRFTLNKKANGIIELHVKKPFLVKLSDNATNIPGDIEFDLVVRIKEARYKVQAGSFILVAAPKGLGKDYVNTYMEHFITTKKSVHMADLYLKSLDVDVQDLINGLIKSMKEPYQPDEDDW